MPHNLPHVCFGLAADCPTSEPVSLMDFQRYRNGRKLFRLVLSSPVLCRSYCSDWQLDCCLTTSLSMEAFSTSDKDVFLSMVDLSKSLRSVNCKMLPSNDFRVKPGGVIDILPGALLLDRVIGYGLNTRLTSGLTRTGRTR